MLILLDIIVTSNQIVSDEIGLIKVFLLSTLACFNLIVH